MSWIILAEADILTAANAPSLAAARTLVLKSGQADPLAEILAQVTAEVRGRVAACSRNTLGEEGTIPDECKSAAIDLCVYRLCKRLGAALLTSAVTEANSQAAAFLRDVARCDVAIVPPATAATDQPAGGAAAEVISTTTRRYGRDNLGGL
jgi:phage gp36-like protein